MMKSALERQLAELKYGDHVAQFYSRPDEALAAAVPFVRLGLESGDRVLYITGEQPIDEVCDVLAAAGVAVEEAQARGALVLQETYQVPVTPGASEFDFVSVYAELQSLIDQAQSDGYRGVRLVAEMTWALAVQDGCAWLTTYEANGNHLLDTNPFIVLCQYHRDHFDPRIVHDMLRTHPWALIDEHLCQNLYYERPELVIDPPAVSERVDWMLTQLVHAHDAEEQRVRLLREQMARAAAEESQQQLQMFLSMVTHELGNALSSMLTNAQVLRRITASSPSVGMASRENDVHHKPTSTSRIDSRVQAIEDAERRMRRLLDDLRDASQIGSGTFSVHPCPVDLTAVVEQVRETYAGASQPRITLNVRADREDLRGEWDEERISQVLTNIVSNAVKYSPEGSDVTITLATSCRLQGAARAAEIRVTDHGPGLTPEQIARLFQPFSRLHQENATKGTGLGLYISKGIVEAHGGQIWVESSPGSSSTFCIALPLLERKASVPHQDEPPAFVLACPQLTAPAVTESAAG